MRKFTRSLLAWRHGPSTQRLLYGWRHRPFTVVIAAVLTIPGVLALIYGDEVSRALSEISAGIISRFMGGALLVGGLTTLIGIARGKALTETLGLTVLALGCGIYGLGVILGLGLAGTVAGSGFLAIALSIVRRVVTLAALPPEVGSDVSRHG